MEVAVRKRLEKIDWILRDVAERQAAADCGLHDRKHEEKNEPRNWKGEVRKPSWMALYGGPAPIAEIIALR